MFSWGLLLAIAPELVPLIVSTIINVESAVKGILKGEVKKQKVMEVIKAILQTKDYFIEGDSAKQSQIYTVVSEAIDFFVTAFNYLGLFKTSKKVDFSPTGGV